MKKILFLFLFATIFPQNAFSADYVFYRSQLANEWNDVYYYTHATQEDKFLWFFTKGTSVCIAPEVDNQPLKTEFYATYPFAWFLYDKNFNPTEANDFLIKMIVKMPYFSGKINNNIKQMRIMNYYGAWIIGVVGGGCSAVGREDEAYMHNNIVKNAKSGDSLEFIFQFPINTKFTAKSLVNFWDIFNSSLIIRSNVASAYKEEEKVKFFAPFLCFGDDACVIEKAELTLMNGEKRDYTKEVQDFKKNSQTFNMADMEYFEIPANMQKIKVWYR